MKHNISSKRKAFLPAVICALLCITCFMGGCASSAKTPTAEEALNSLKAAEPKITSVTVYTADTDPNGILGTKGAYTGKAAFTYEGIEGDGGNIEVFENSDDCKARYNYLLEFTSEDLGIFALNQYIYMYDKAVFRVSKDISTEEAESLKTKMDKIMGQTGK